MITQHSYYINTYFFRSLDTFKILIYILVFIQIKKYNIFRCYFFINMKFNFIYFFIFNLIILDMLFRQVFYVLNCFIYINISNI